MIWLQFMGFDICTKMVFDSANYLPPLANGSNGANNQGIVYINRSLVNPITRWTRYSILEHQQIFLDRPEPLQLESLRSIAGDDSFYSRSSIRLLTTPLVSNWSTHRPIQQISTPRRCHNNPIFSNLCGELFLGNNEPCSLSNIYYYLGGIVSRGLGNQTFRTRLNNMVLSAYLEIAKKIITILSPSSIVTLTLISPPMTLVLSRDNIEIFHRIFSHFDGITME
jgi:hypothetical protein